MGAFGGHFGPFWSDFGAQSRRLEPVWSLFLTRLASQNDLNSPKFGTVGQGNYHTGLVGAFGGLFGPFWGLFQSDFRAQSKRLGPVLSIFDMCLAAQNDLHGPKSGKVGQGKYQT